jgi:hypothetical protein
MCRPRRTKRMADADWFEFVCIIGSLFENNQSVLIIDVITLTNYYLTERNTIWSVPSCQLQRIGRAIFVNSTSQTMLFTPRFHSIACNLFTMFLLHIFFFFRFYILFRETVWEVDGQCNLVLSFSILFVTTVFVCFCHIINQNNDNS